MSHLDHSAVNKDKEEKKRLLLSVITSLCVSSSPFADLQAIGRELDNGCKLDAKIITGGLTNYSYKVYMQEAVTSTDATGNIECEKENKSHINDKCSNRPALYAKICFQHALWNPSKAHYDLARTDNEFKVMNAIHKLRPDIVPIPYHCIDIEDDMKVLVTQWCPTDEQLANQFIDGSVDLRIVPKIADVVALLHCQEVTNPDFNTNVRPCMLDLFDVYRSTMMAPFDNKNGNYFIPKDRTEKMFVEYGKDILTRIADNNIKNYNARDCLVHSDVHVFNILVEAKPSIEALELFGPKGSVILCDWEMAFIGPIGRDIGLAQAFPLACIVSHAINGHEEAVDNLMQFIDKLWDGYATVMKQNGKTEEELTTIYRNCLGWTGWFAYLIFYTIGAQAEFFPVDEVGDTEMVKDSMGVLGLKLLRWAFGDFEMHLTLGELQTKYKEAINDEIRYALRTKRPSIRSRRSSILRQSGRRVSDTPINFPDISRLSFTSCSSLGLETVVID